MKSHVKFKTRNRVLSGSFRYDFEEIQTTTSYRISAVN